MNDEKTAGLPNSPRDENEPKNDDSDLGEDCIDSGEEDTSEDDGGGEDTEGDASDDSLNGTLDKCPICLRIFRQQDVGTPDTCEHCFCLKCILEWSDNVTTCPIDRKTFHSVLVLDKVRGEVVRIQELTPTTAQLNEDYDEFSDPTFCEVCGCCDREDRLLLCDECDDGYHLECLDPPLEAVPTVDWYCSACATVRGRALALSDAAAERNRTRMPRTGLSRRIMQRRRRDSAPNSSLTSTSCTDECLPVTRRNRSVSGVRSTRSTTRGRKRATTSRKRSRAGKGKRRVRRKRTRKQRVALERRPATPRGRLIQQLGIQPPRPGQVYVGLPSCRPSFTPAAESSTSAAAIRTQRHQAGIAPLRIYSTVNDLADYFEVSSDEEGGASVMRPQPIRIGDSRKRVLASATAQPASSINVLGPILSRQHILLLDKNIQISSGDGRLVSSMSVNPDKILFSPNNENDSSGYDSFGNRGSPSRIRSHGTGIRGIVTSALNSGGTNASNSREAGGSGSSNPSTEGSSSGNSGFPASSGLNISSPSRSLASSTSNSVNNSANSTNVFEDFGVLDEPVNKLLLRKKDNPTESEKEDDEFNIYSDIEDDPRPAPTIRRFSDGASDFHEVATLDGCGGGGESDNDDDMVIDEADAASGSGPRGRELRSDPEPIVPQAANFQGDDVLSENGSESLPPGDVDPDSPLSIPLPDSTPPPSVREGPSLEDEDTHELSADSTPKDEEPMAPVKEKDEYDPCHPLTSSEDEEEVPLPQSQPLNTATKVTPSPQKSKSAATPSVEVSSIPLPGDEYRRPTIQFSIPSRHRIFSMGSLVRRNKGVMKKETKAEGSISFQSEMSKAFTRKADDPGTSASTDTEKLSLVAEIFGSDEEEEEEVPAVPSLVEGENSVSVIPLPTLVAEIPVEPPPVVESTTEGLEGSKWRKIVEDEPEVISIVPPKCLPIPAPTPAGDEDEDDDVVVIGEAPPEVQIIETPPPEPEDELPSSRDRHEKKSDDPPTTNLSDGKSPKPDTADSIDSHSDSENEFERQRLRERKMNAKKKDEEKRRDRRSKSPKKDKENKRSQKRRRSFSPESNCEEGEIPDKKKKKAKKSKKSKKRRRSGRSRSSSSSDRASFSEKTIPEDTPGQMTEEEEGSKDVHWKKPSKSSKERNYRDGKPKTEEKYFRERDKKQESEATGRTREREKSPILSIQQSTSQEDIRRDRSWSRGEKRTSRRRSRSRGKRTHSKHSNRSSSSIKNFRSRSRSTNSRSSKSHQERRHRDHSFSPNRRRSPPNSSRGRRTLHRSRSPVKRSRKRSRSDRSRQMKQRSRSSSRSQSTPPQRRKQRSPAVLGRNAPKKSKDLKEKKFSGETKELEPSVSLPDSTKEKIIGNISGEKEKRKKKKRREKSISPAKAIFADGDSIVVSLNFQTGKELAEKDGDGKRGDSGDKNSRDGSNSKDKGSGEKSKSIKKTVLIDLESSPIQEQNIGVSPTLIVLSDDEEGHERNFKADDSDQERLAVSTTSIGDSGKSPLYRGERDCLGVPADSTQLQLHPTDISKGVEFPHGRNSTSESDTGNTPARGDALVTSTRDSVDRNGAAPDEYPISPCTPPKDSSSPNDMSITPPLPGSPPPLPAPRVRSPDHHPKQLPPPTHLVSTPNVQPMLVSNPTLPPRPMGIGNIPGLFPSNKLHTLASGNVLGQMPIVIPNPPMPQLRLPPPNLFNQSVLATVANALYGPLMGVQSRYGLGQHHQAAAVNPNLTSRMPGNVIGKKPGGEGPVLLPKDQNFSGHRRTEGGGDSPFSPNSSDGDDLFEPPKDPNHQNSAKNPPVPNPTHRTEKGPGGEGHGGDGGPNGKGKGRPAARIFDSLFGGPIRKSSASGGNQNKGDGGSKSKSGHKHKSKKGGQRKAAVNLSEGELRLTEEVPTSAVELRVKEKFLKKLNRQERVVEEVKVSLKPHYSKKHISKEEYKDILRRAVPKICHNKTGEINPIKIKELIEAYVKKCRKTRKK